MSSEWATLPLSGIAKIAMGETLLSKDLTGCGVPVFSANTDSEPWGYTSRNKKTLKRGTIVIGARGSIGFPRLPAFETFTSTQTTISIEPDTSLADSTFLHALLCATDIKSLAAHQAVPMLTIGMISPLTVFLPPLDEQRRIGAVLRSVDDAIIANEKAAAATRHLVNYLATEVASRATKHVPIGKTWDVVTGRTPSPANLELWDGDLPFVTPGDIGDETISVRSSARSLNATASHGSKVVPAGSLLVTCIGSTVGKMGLATVPTTTNQQINAVRVPPEVSGYAYLACLSIVDEIVANAGKQAVPIINKSTFSALEVPLLPPEEMKEVSGMVLALDEQITAAQATIDQLRQVKQQIAQDLLSGHVRVPA